MKGWESPPGNGTIASLQFKESIGDECVSLVPHGAQSVNPEEDSPSDAGQGDSWITNGMEQRTRQRIPTLVRFFRGLDV